MGEPANDVGFQVNRLSRQIRMTANQMAFLGQSDTPVTGMQGWIIGYLYNHRDRDVFQRDIQTQFSIRRSTATGTLQLMEKNGLIRRSPVDWDARLKKIELTPKALEMHERVMEGIKAVERTIASSLTSEEWTTFMRLCEKIRQGLKNVQLPEKN